MVFSVLKLQKWVIHFQKIPLVFYAQARTFAAEFRGSKV